MEYDTKKPIVISFFSEARSDSTHYMDEANRFRNELEELRQKTHRQSHIWHGPWDYQIDKIHGFRNYYRNARFKPMYIWYKMVKYNRPILWLDADTQLSDEIPFEDFREFDFAGVKHQLPEISLAIYAHCLWFNNTNTGKSILKNWVDICNKELSAKEMHVKQIGDHSELCHNVLPKFYPDRDDIPLIDGKFCDFKITPKSEKLDYIDE